MALNFYVFTVSHDVHFGWSQMILFEGHKPAPVEVILDSDMQKFYNLLEDYIGFTARQAKKEHGNSQEFKIKTVTSWYV